MASSFRVSPGVFWNLLDESEIPSTIETSTGAQVFAADRGSLTPIYTSDRADFVRSYGKNNPSTSYAHDAAFAFHKQASGLWNLRVVGEGALYGTALIANNKNYDGTGYNGTSITRLNGSELPYSSFNRDIQDIVFSGNLATGHSVTVTINEEDSAAVSFTSSHLNTMRLVAQAVQTVLDNLGFYGTAAVVEPDDGSAARIIRIVSPETVTEMDISVEMGGSTPPTAVVRATEWLYVGIAENPGQWSNNLAYQIQNVDAGVQQRMKISFSAPLAATHTFYARINDTVIGPVTFSTDNNTTLTAIATAIRTALGSRVASVDVVTVAGSNANRELLIVGKDAFTTLTVNEITMGGTVPPAAVHRTTIGRQEPVNSFTLAVYEGSDLATPVDTYRGSLVNQQDGFNNQLEMSYQTNSGPRKSKNIRLYANPLLATSNWLVRSSTTPNYTTRKGYMGGGDDGAAVTSSDIINGWAVFEDTTLYSMRILINTGYTAVEIQKAMVELCETRHDCVAILDAPAAYQEAQALAAYRKTELGIDSSYAAIYSPDILIYDTTSGKRRYSPPSGYIAARYAYTDRVRHEWFAAAGLNRGIIAEALDLRYNYKAGEQELLALAQVNPIIDHRGRKAVWGEMTMQYKASALQSMPVRRLCNTIEIIAVDTVAYSLFEPNDEGTQKEVKRKIDDLMEPIKRARGIRKYETICDKSNNPPSEQDNRNLNVAVFFVPTLPVLRIYITGVITRQGGNFTELIQQGVAGFNADATAL